MSFYFYLGGPKTVKLGALLAAVDIENLSYLADEEQNEDAPILNEVVFFQPNQSVRGVVLYENDEGYEIGLNAFTSLFDVRLARSLALALGELMAVRVRPEDVEHPMDAVNLARHCDKTWEDGQVLSANSILEWVRSPEVKPASTLTISGYRRAFHISEDLIAELENKGLSDLEIIEELFDQARKLQEIDQNEDIFAANLMQIELSENNTKSGGILRRLFKKWQPLQKEPERFTYFVLSQDVRTLTPEAEFVMLWQEEEFRRLPFSQFQDFARSQGFPRFGASCYYVPDLPMNVYLQLFHQAELFS